VAMHHLSHTGEGASARLAPVRSVQVSFRALGPIEPQNPLLVVRARQFL